VGRFKKFAAVYSQNMIAPGLGANPNNPQDAGWMTDWNSSLPTSSSGLTVSDATYSTIGRGDDRLPINDLYSWEVAQAFCIWDGGRLPTEAEWNYAAAGGSEQRIYPWGSSTLNTNATLAIYNCNYPTAGGQCTGYTNLARVGSVLAGIARWGQFDMAGNVWEWTQDWNDTYPTPCNNCATLGGQTWHSFRGGAYNLGASFAATADRPSTSPTYFTSGSGIRCARAR